MVGYRDDDGSLSRQIGNQFQARILAHPVGPAVLHPVRHRYGPPREADVERMNLSVHSEGTFSASSALRSRFRTEGRLAPTLPWEPLESHRQRQQPRNPWQPDWSASE
jgi:hypothetical protein